jgi:hypothetical protein
MANSKQKPLGSNIPLTAWWCDGVYTNSRSLRLVGAASSLPLPATTLARDPEKDCVVGVCYSPLSALDATPSQRRALFKGSEASSGY